MTTRHNWTQQENEQIAMCIEQGMSNSQIEQQVAFTDIPSGAMKAKCQLLRQVAKDSKLKKVTPTDKSKYLIIFQICFLIQ